MEELRKSPSLPREMELNDDHEMHDIEFTEEQDLFSDEVYYIPRTPKKRKAWYNDMDLIKILIMLTLVVAFFIAELVVGILAKSLALLADAFHMLSDGISLVIGASAIILSKRKGNDRFTYGFGRAETLGGLINSVFLLSAVLFILMESIERFTEPTFIDNPWLVFGVGLGGMLINVLGMIMFCGHAHGGHGHSHGGHGHSHGVESSDGEHSHSGHGHSHGGHGHSHGKEKKV